MFGFSPRLALGCACGLALALLPAVCLAVEPESLGTIVRHDPRFDKIVPPGAQVERIAQGFDWSEGPVWIPAADCLLFSDVPRNRVHQWRAKTGTSVFLEPSGYTGGGEYSREPGSNGLAVDRQLRLILCQHGDRRVTRIEPDGRWTTLADRYQGKRFNSPNDLAIHSSGAVYFTDPPYGLPKQADDPTRELDYCGVFRIAPDGQVTLLTKDLARPNGIAFSPDEKTLYVAQSDSARPIWMAYPVAADGQLGAGRVFFDATKLIGKKPGGPDGLKVDQAGNLFASGPGGILVFAPDGTLLGEFNTGQATANCAFGEDGSTLFITADMYLGRVRLSTKGTGF